MSRLSLTRTITAAAALITAAPLLTADARAEPPRLSVGYYGDIITHPGGFAGASWDIAEAGAFSFHLGGELGGYHHERNHTGLFARAVLGNRITADNGAFFESRFTGGYLHTLLDGDGLWRVDDAGGVEAVNSSGSPNVLYGLGLGGGWQSDGPLGLVMRGELLGRAPYNGYALDQFSLMVGVEWQLGGGAG